MEQILVFGLACPFWVSFRYPSTVNAHLSYPFPPPTTLYGMLNAARGKPQDWHADRDTWQFSLIIESSGLPVETFSKIMKVYEIKGKAEPLPNGKYPFGVFSRTTLIRQKLIGTRYSVYLKAQPEQLQEALQALSDPHWSLYLGESDDVVDVVEPRIVECIREPLNHAHSIIPGIQQGCRLVNVPLRYYQVGQRWTVDYQVYSLPPDDRGTELSKPIMAYMIEDRNVIFNDPNSSQTQSNVVRSSLGLPHRV